MGDSTHVSAIHAANPTARHHITTRRALLACGVLAGLLYPIADIVGAMRYPGFSYRDMAVSELFAIGAPTSGLIVLLFSVSSALLLLCAIGIALSANGRRLVQWMAAMLALNAIDALVLWNFFPMHMRGVTPTFTDTMHGALAIDPFVLVLNVLAAIALRGWFRVYTIATVVCTTVLALTAIRFVPLFLANEPTPWMGASERAGQYAMNLWYAVLAVHMMREVASRQHAMS